MHVLIYSRHAWGIGDMSMHLPIPGDLLVHTFEQAMQCYNTDVYLQNY